MEKPDFAILKRCPGFEPAQAGDVVPPDYAPAPRNQTVASWRAGQSDPDQLTEVHHYTRTLLPAFAEAHLHAPTEDNPGGTLSDDQTIELGARYFYRPLPAPADPREDHAALMAWMEGLVANVPQIAREIRGA